MGVLSLAMTTERRAEDLGSVVQCEKRIFCMFTELSHRRGGYLPFVNNLINLHYKTMHGEYLLNNKKRVKHIADV